MDNVDKEVLVEEEKEVVEDIPVDHVDPEEEVPVDEVNLVEVPVYQNAKGRKSRIVSGNFYLTGFPENGRRAITNYEGEIVGWIYLSDLDKEDKSSDDSLTTAGDSSLLKVGDIVRINHDVTYYRRGRRIPSRVKYVELRVVSFLPESPYYFTVSTTSSDDIEGVLHVSDVHKVSHDE